MQPKMINLKVNGHHHQVASLPNATLLRVLRETLGYLDVKNGCEKGDCGACTVLLNGKPVNSCLVLAWQADGAEITTAAGLGSLNSPHVIQQAFADVGAAQCGYCTPGMVIAAKALLDANPHPTEERYSRSHFRQFMPLHRLRPDRQSRPSCRRALERRPG